MVSLGGNALLRRGDRGTIEEQFDNVRTCASQLARLLPEGCAVVMTHGNGPIVGNIVIRNEAARNTVPPMPLYICDADSEGGIGFMIQQTLYNELRRVWKSRPVVTVITQVVVDAGDPAFVEPTKPIGPYYTAEEAEALQETKAWRLIEDSGRGYRRVVPSPRPLRIVESRVIRDLALGGVIVIAAGGGGIPVVEDDAGTLEGVDAVIDKDLTTASLARELGADRILNLTSVDRVYLNYGSPSQVGLDEVSVEELRTHAARRHFAPGSMEPKIQGAIDFLEGGGREVIITSPERLQDAVDGRAGTRVHP